MTASLGRRCETRPRVRPRGRNPRTAVSRWLVVAALTMLAQQGWAVCTVSTTGVNFGSYDTFSSLNLDGAGTVTVNCDISAPYTLSLSPGGGTYLSRAMASGAHILNYNLYSNATRTTVWGDGTASTVTISGTATASIPANQTVYGRIPAMQNAYVGSYSDSITVTLTF